MEYGAGVWVQHQNCILDYWSFVQILVGIRFVECAENKAILVSRNFVLEEKTGIK